MTVIRIPWRAWYGDEDLELNFPPSWQARAYWPDGAPDIGDAGIEAAFDHPIGAPRIEELAQGARSVALAVEDISRPAAVGRLMPALLRRLELAGVDLDHVRVVLGVGMHRPMVKEDIIKKIGPLAADRLDVHNSHPYENAVDLGTTPRGTPVRISRWFAEAELKLGVGGITPHSGPGFGGGAKVIVPGVASLQTIASIHQPGRLKTGLGDVGVELRQEMEYIARHHVGLKAIINVVPNARRQVTGVFVGDLVEAHRAGVAFARGVFATTMPTEPVDVAVCNAYPKDTDFLQFRLGLTPLNSSLVPVVKPGGVVVLVTASPEGRGYHSLYGPGMHLNPLQDGQADAPYPPLRYGQEELVIFSPNVTRTDARSDAVFRQWEDLVEYLGARFASPPSVAVFPCGAIQLARPA